MICHQVYLDLDYLTHFVTSGNDPLGKPVTQSIMKGHNICSYFPPAW